jgi:hypothetical protein
MIYFNSNSVKGGGWGVYAPAGGGVYYEGVLMVMRYIFYYKIEIERKKS